MRLTIIGAGPGGYETALYAARRGMEVTLVGDGPLGGACLNEGCIPTKALCRAAELYEDCRSAADFGILADPVVDFGRVQARKEAVVRQLREGVAFQIRQGRVRYLEGRAQLLDAHTLSVHLADGGSETLRSDFILMATGAVASVPPIPGVDLPGVVTSREMLSVPDIPRRLCVIGAGVIGLEFASIFAAFGSEVRVVEYADEVLPRFDKDLSRRLKQSLVKRGISIDTSVRVSEITPLSVGLHLQGDRKGNACSAEADLILVATGRRPATESLDLAAVGIAYDRGGVKVNASMQTSLPSVYAVGDLTGGSMLAHAASFQGRRAVHHMLAGQPSEGVHDGIDLSLVPAAVFTRPEVAFVGLTEEACKAQGIAYRSSKAFFRANGKAVVMGETEGYCKLLSDPADGRILGCHLFGAHAADLVHEAAVLMGRRGTLAELRTGIHAHPTLSEVMLAAAQ